MKKLTRSNDRIIAGVCGGIAQYLNVSAKSVRIAYLIFFLICSLSTFGAVIPLSLYVLLMIILPEQQTKTNIFNTSKTQTKERKIIKNVKEQDVSNEDK